MHVCITYINASYCLLKLWLGDGCYWNGYRFAPPSPFLLMAFIFYFLWFSLWLSHTLSDLTWQKMSRISMWKNSFVCFSSCITFMSTRFSLHMNLVQRDIIVCLQTVWLFLWTISICYSMTIERSRTLYFMLDEKG